VALTSALLATQVAVATPGPWAIDVGVGWSNIFLDRGPVFGSRTRGTVSIDGRYELWSWLDLALGGRLGLSENTQHFDLLAGLLVDLDFGPVALRFGPRVGAGTMRYSWAGSPHWASYAILNGTASVAVRLAERWQLDIAAVSASLYLSEVAFLLWEPSLRVSYRF